MRRAARKSFRKLTFTTCHKGNTVVLQESKPKLLLVEHILCQSQESFVVSPRIMTTSFIRYCKLLCCCTPPPLSPPPPSSPPPLILLFSIGGARGIYGIQYLKLLYIYIQHIGNHFLQATPGVWAEKKKQTEEKANVVAAVWGTEFIKFHAALQIYHQDDLEKRMNRIKATWWNGCFEKMDDQPSINSNDLCLLFCLYPSSMGVRMTQLYIKCVGYQPSYCTNKLWNVEKML